MLPPRGGRRTRGCRSRRTGNREQATLDAETLPAAARSAPPSSTGAVMRAGPGADGGPGLAPARGQRPLLPRCAPAARSIGLIAVESTTPDRFGAKDVELLNGLVEPLGVAIDNARWFGRLRTIGADEERSRIARDLHDRIGQSLAYLAFELDRAVRVAERGDDVRSRARSTCATRCAASSRRCARRSTTCAPTCRDGQDVGATMELFVDRVQRAQRARDRARPPRAAGPPAAPAGAGAVAHRQGGGHQRRAPRQGAAARRSRWRCDGKRAELEVADDGVGFDQATAVAIDSYGILGMRERADQPSAPRFDIRLRPWRRAPPSVWSSTPEDARGGRAMSHPPDARRRPPDAARGPASRP